MEERRTVGRVPYQANSVVVVCDTQQSFQAQVQDVSPLGMGIKIPADAPDILNKDVIVVAETMIMYATVSRLVHNDDGTDFIGIAAKKFTPEVLQYLFECVQ